MSNACPRRRNFRRPSLRRMTGYPPGSRFCARSRRRNFRRPSLRPSFHPPPGQCAWPRRRNFRRPSLRLALSELPPPLITANHFRRFPGGGTSAAPHYGHPRPADWAVPPPPGGGTSAAPHYGPSENLPRPVRADPGGGTSAAPHYGPPDDGLSLGLGGPRRRNFRRPSLRRKSVLVVLRPGNRPAADCPPPPHYGHYYNPH